MKMMAKGLEVRKRWGRENKAVKEALIESIICLLPEAFSMIALERSSPVSKAKAVWVNLCG